MCAYQGVRNVSFSESFAYVLNGWFPANPTEQRKIVEEYFKKTFYKAFLLEPYHQRKWQYPEETMKVIAKIKSNKRPGCGEISVKFIKYAPETIHEQMAKIYNTITETGDTLTEIHTEL